MISYYELLGRIKEGDIPNRIEVSLTLGTSKVYRADYDVDDFCCYILEEGQEKDENYDTFLANSLLERTMFEENIKILSLGSAFPVEFIENTNPTKEELKEKINEIIKYLK